MYFFAPSGFQFQALQQAGQNFAAHGGKLSQLGPLLGRGGQYNLQVDSDLEGYGYTFYQDVANFDVGVFLNGYFNGSSIGYAEMLAVGEAYAAGLVNGVPSSNWSPAQTVQWAQWWTAGWNAAQTGNYPGQLGPLRSGREPIVSAKMSNHAGMKHTVIIIAAACSVGSSYAAVSDPTVLGAMQAFQDFCLSSDLSLEAIADLAKDRHYKLVVDRRLPGPSGSIIVNNTWQATDITGNFALTVTQADGLKPGRRFQCGVSLPKGTETNVESALTDPSHFGVPDQVNVNLDGSRMVQWLRHFEWGTATVSLTSKVPSLQGGSIINVLYQAEK